jgi:hypothetical protein
MHYQLFINRRFIGTIADPVWSEVFKLYYGPDGRENGELRLPDDTYVQIVEEPEIEDPGHPI